MAHTQGRYQQDLGFTDGIIVYAAQAFSQLPAVSGALTRNNPADFSWNVGAGAGPLNLQVNLFNGEMLRTGFGEDLQEQFGGTGIPASAQPQFYRPDVIGGMASLQQITPRTALKTKGIKPLALKVSYLITGAALTTHTCRVDKIVYVNNVANAVTAIIATGANGLATATQANPYTTVVPFPANQQLYQITDLASMWFEITVTTQGGGAYRLQGAELSVEYNFN